MQSFQMQTKVATSFQSGVNYFFFSNNPAFLALTPHGKGNIYSVTGMTLQDTMSLRLNCSKHVCCQALLKIHCIDLAASKDPPALSSNWSLSICSVSHNIAFGRIPQISIRFFFFSQDLYMELVLIIYKDPFRSTGGLRLGKEIL